MTLLPCRDRQCIIGSSDYDEWRNNLKRPHPLTCGRLPYAWIGPTRKLRVNCREQGFYELRSEVHIKRDFRQLQGELAGNGTLREYQPCSAGNTR